MKLLITVLSLLLSLSVYADIEYSPGDDSVPTTEEISKNRACFEEVASHGCGDPGEDPNHFKSCLKNIHSGLTSHCKTMMSDLYDTK